MTPNVNLMGSFYTPSSRKWSFYSSADCNNDYLKYVDKGGKAGECLDYLGYAGNPEKSSGAFSSDGLLTAQEKSEIRKELKSTKSCVWDYVVSFEEGYGKEKIRSWRDAQALIAKEFPKFLKANGMDVSKVHWFAGLHENTDNRHIHLCFWEKEPERIVAHQTGRRWHSLERSTERRGRCCSFSDFTKQAPFHSTFIGASSPDPGLLFRIPSGSLCRFVFLSFVLVESWLL